MSWDEAVNRMESGHLLTTPMYWSWANTVWGVNDKGVYHTPLASPSSRSHGQRIFNVPPSWAPVQQFGWEVVR